MVLLGVSKAGNMCSPEQVEMLCFHCQCMYVSISTVMKDLKCSGNNSKITCLLKTALYSSLSGRDGRAKKPTNIYFVTNMLVWRHGVQSCALPHASSVNLISLFPHLSAGDNGTSPDAKYISSGM